LRPWARLARTPFEATSEVLAATSGLAVSLQPVKDGAVGPVNLEEHLPKLTIAPLISSQFRYGTYSRRYPLSITCTGPDPVTANIVANSRELCGHDSAISARIGRARLAIPAAWGGLDHKEVCLGLA